MSNDFPTPGRDALRTSFSMQSQVRGPWRGYLDELVSIRPDLYAACLRLTGNVWDAEDLAQESLLKVFSLLGKIDADLQHPKAYLIRTATNLWIDKVRRVGREKAMMALRETSDVVSETTAADAIDARIAAAQLLARLHPQERAAVVIKDLLDYSLEDTATVLNTSVGAIKSALQRGRSRLSHRREQAPFGAPSRSLVETFMVALRDRDAPTLKAICDTQLTLELVGGAETHSFEESETFFQHAHFVMPDLGFGENPNWRLVEYLREPMVLGLRTLDGIEGINEVHRLEETDGKITKIRCYCFCPDTLSAIGKELGLNALSRPYRSPSPGGMRRT